VLHNALGELLAGFIGDVVFRSRRTRSRLRATAKPIENAS
jgi:hypothetical protein